MKYTTNIFINKAIKIHGDKYDYSLVNYIGSKNNIDIICKVHGVFRQIPNSHLNGKGCKQCCIDKSKLTTEKFINKSKQIHGEKYDYSLVEYEKCCKKVKIICKVHGVFEQTPFNHYGYKCGCPKCNDIKLTTEEFINKAKQIHGEKYDYSLVEYKNIFFKVKIICKVHGIFEQKPFTHYYDKCGCLKCQSSHGENNIRKFLIDNNIMFEEQKKINGCKNINLLPFDFFLPNKNILIEYDGEQHFRKTSIFGGIKGFEKRKINDNIKNNFCSVNNIKLIRIKYNENINEVLTNILLKE